MQEVNHPNTTAANPASMHFAAPPNYRLDEMSSFSPDGCLLATTSRDKSIRLWTPATGTLQQTLEGHSDSVESLAFSPDGRLLASASRDTTVRVWGLDTGALWQTLDGHSDWVKSVAFSPDGGMLASASYDATVRLWDPIIGTMHRAFEGHFDSVKSIAFSPNGHLLASASRDTTVRIWDLAMGALHQTLQGHSDWVDAVAFSPDSRLLASASRDKTIRLWDSATGALQLAHEGEGIISHLQFSQGGSQIITNLGSLNIRLGGDSSNTNSHHVDPEIFVEQGQWVVLKGKKALWLPAESRPCCLAINSNVLALGLRSGRVFFLGFCL